LLGLVANFRVRSYNDEGELLPFQGGTNEMVANKLYLDLEPEERQRLHVHYYVAKDQMKPIHNKFKQRSCHGKIGSARTAAKYDLMYRS
jgi:hypothetical protein